MNEGSVTTEQRLAAQVQLKKAKAGIEELLSDSLGKSDARSLFERLQRWLPTVTEAINDTGNLLSDRDPLARVMELRTIAQRLRQLGQRKTDEIAKSLENADAFLMDA
jgi:hypothetical protein